MSDLDALFGRVARIAADYRGSLADGAVTAAAGPGEVAARLGALADRGCAAEDVVDELVRAVEPGLVRTAGPRFFGFVIGGATAASTAADMLATGWDQCAFNAVLSPAAAAVEEVAGAWLTQLLGLPATASVGFVTGGQAANTVGLAAGRHAVLAGCGWDVESAGLAGAPRTRIIASEERHATIDRALRLLGYGTASIEPVATDGNGAIDLPDLARVLSGGSGGPTIVCLQAGNVNTGACDDFPRAVPLAKEHGAWVHVDGAFGLWAAASPTHRHLVAGVEAADSWGCDGHKWLNLPYDIGFAVCAHPDVHRRAVSYTAAYLTGSGGALAGPADHTLESSRRARGFAVWAGIRELGREGLADLVTRCCEHASRFAELLAAAGAEIGNDVVLNQVLVRFDDDVTTDRVVDLVQQDGTCWFGATTWRGRRYMRIAVSNWSTTRADVDRSVVAVLQAVTSARAEAAGRMAGAGGDRAARRPPRDEEPGA